MRKGGDAVILLPLALLALVPLALRAGDIFDPDPARAFVSAMRYFVIPLFGLSIGACLFIAALRGRLQRLYAALEDDGSERRILIAAGVVFIAYYLSIGFLRYHTLHDGMFDLGVYDNKIWRIAGADGVWAKLRESSVRHFQPALIIHAFLYNAGAQPWALQALQAVIVASGAVPLYLLCRLKLKDVFITVSTVLIYFIYTSTGFNAALDFRPDHISIPVLLWAFYFIETRRYFYVAALLVFTSGIKETFILTSALMAVYAFIRERAWAGAVAVLLFSMVVFYYVSFVLIPQFSSQGVGQAFVENPAFSSVAGESLGGLLGNALDPAKFRFPFFVLLPLLALPLFKPLGLMPALPAFAFAALSSSVHHQGVASHYTAAVIPAAFYSYVCAIDFLKKRFGDRLSFGLILWAVVLNVSFNVAHSPTPLAAGFWDRSWSRGAWHFSNYMKDGHFDALKEAIALIPEDPGVKLVSHSRVYHPRLAHRLSYEPFPVGWRQADCVLIDETRGPYMADNLDSKGYYEELGLLRKDGSFRAVYEKDGVIVFARR